MLYSTVTFVSITCEWFPSAHGAHHYFGAQNNTAVAVSPTISFIRCDLSTLWTVFGKFSALNILLHLEVILGHLCVNSLDCALNHLVYVVTELYVELCSISYSTTRPAVVHESLMLINADCAIHLIFLFIWKVKRNAIPSRSELLGTINVAESLLEVVLPLWFACQRLMSR
jgi:hypothetical protein